MPSLILNLCPMLAVLLLVTACGGPALAFDSDEKVDGKDSEKTAKPVRLGAWKTLFGGASKTIKKSQIEVLEDFELFGAKPNDTNLLNHVVVDGEWAVQRGVLFQKSGRCAALKLGTSADFELEMKLNAEGTGGWFLLCGYNNGQGYGVYNVNLRSSGSPWHVSEFSRGRGIPETDREIVRYACRGEELLKFSVVSNRLKLQFNRRVLIDEDVPDYQSGDIILGTYDTQYGPKPLKILGIRLRTSLEQE